jgi:hypothetical protein
MGHKGMMLGTIVTQFNLNSIGICEQRQNPRDDPPACTVAQEASKRGVVGDL